MSIIEKCFVASIVDDHRDLIAHFRTKTEREAGHERIPVRFVVTAFDDVGYRCEVAMAKRTFWTRDDEPSSIFDFVPRQTEDTSSFNVVLLVPTGIGAEIGGHAGDSTPVAQLLGSGCDTLILHPNVVNASDINEGPSNSLYLEGSTIARLLMGTIGVQRVRSNRVLAVVDGAHNKTFVNATINSINAARACFGMECAGVWLINPAMSMSSEIAGSGRVGGRIENLDFLIEQLRNRRDEFDAISISSAIMAPDGTVLDYFAKDGDMVNPWGGVEAMLTHTITSVFGVPSAHSPMMESSEIASADLGVVDPRLAAESVSMTFVNCVLKGLQRSPRIISDRGLFGRPEVLSARNISCIVVPDGVLGIPTLAALEQGMKVIAVKENRNLMRNDLSQLPWKPGQFTVVQNYLEASGLLNAMKAGIDPQSLQRPLLRVRIEHLSRESLNKSTEVNGYTLNGS